MKMNVFFFVPRSFYIKKVLRKSLTINWRFDALPVIWISFPVFPHLQHFPYTVSKSPGLERWHAEDLSLVFPHPQVAHKFPGDLMTPSSLQGHQAHIQCT